MTFQMQFRGLILGTLLCAAVGCSSDSDDDDTSDAGNDAAVTRGATAVKTRDCAMCHAAADKSLSGSTTPRPGTMAYAPNLTPDDTGIGSWTDAQIVKAILNGVDDEDAMLCAVMPRFAALGMKQAEAEDIAAYLKSLPPVAHEIPESTCPEKK
jgi:mono/diheme cytochrome c family protein